MTGNCKLVQKVYAKHILCVTKPDQIVIMIANCGDILSRRDIMQLTNAGIPVIQDNITTKKQLIDYILSEIKEYIPVAQGMHFRQLKKAAHNLCMSVDRLVKDCVITMRQRDEFLTSVFASK